MAIDFPEGQIHRPSLTPTSWSTLNGQTQILWTGIPSSCTYLKICFADMSTSNSFANRHKFRMGSGSISTSNYYWISTSSGSENQDSDNTDFYALTNNIHTGNNHAEAGILECVRHMDGGWLINWQGWDRASNFPWRGSGFWAVNSSIDRVLLFCSSGTWDGGNVSMSYL
jgi:hypothetical protein